jgi:hypothetical protein
LFGRNRDKERARNLNALDESCRATRAVVFDRSGAIQFGPTTGNHIDIWQRTWGASNTRRPPNGGWDWASIVGNRSEESRQFCITLQDNAGVVCGFGLVRIARRAVCLEAIEGNPDPNHSLRGSVIPIYLDMLAQAAQRLRKPRVHLINPNSGLAQIYVRDYGFELITNPNGTIWCRREV